MPKRKADAPPEPVPEDDDEEQEEDEDSEDEDEDSSGSESGDSDDSYPDVSDDDAEDSPGEEDEEYKEINVDFLFNDPKEADYLGLRALLTNYLDGEQYDVSGLSDAVIKQTMVGTVVKSEEDSDPFAVLTVFNVAQHKEETYMKQLRAFMEARCADAAVKEKLTKAMEDKATGFLVSERLINCPPKIAPPLTQFLFDEISWAVEDEDTPEKREQYKFQRYVILTRVWKDPQDDGEEGPRDPGQPSTSKPKKAKKGGGGPASDVIVYVRPEDEFLHKDATWFFTFPVENRPVPKDELRPMRLVYCIDASKVPAARKALDEAIGNMAAEKS